jgi:hypothetical protein
MSTDTNTSASANLIPDLKGGDILSHFDHHASSINAWDKRPVLHQDAHGTRHSIARLRRKSSADIIRHRSRKQLPLSFLHYSEKKERETYREERGGSLGYGMPYIGLIAA